MRHLWTVAAALCCTLLLAACSGEGEGPSTAAVEADLQTEIDRLIGGPNLVALDGLDLGEPVVLDANGTRVKLTWNGTVEVVGPVFAPVHSERFGIHTLTTYGPATAVGASIPIQGDVGYILENGTWTVAGRPRLKLMDGQELRNIGVAESVLAAGGNLPEGSDAAAAKRAELQAAAQTDDAAAAQARQKAQEARARREAEKQATIDAHKQRKAEEQEAERKAQEGATAQP